MALVKCGICGRKTEEGIFCEKCGAELSEVKPADGDLGSEKKGEATVLDLSPFTDGLETLDSDSTIDIAPPPTPTPKPPEPRFCTCPLFNVEHDQNRVFVVGQTMNFRFALTPLAEGLSDVFVAVVFEGRGRKVEVKRLGWIPCQGERRELKNINFDAPEAGSLGFSFYFGFTHNGEEVVFEADGEHKVWPSHARARDVVHNLEINIQNSGHATDFNLSGIKDQLASEETLEEVIDRLHRIPPLWSGLPLYASTWRPPRQCRQETTTLVPVSLWGAAPSAAKVDRLTLRIGGRRLHLLSDEVIRMGKNRNNDIVTRLYKNGQAPRDLNSKISRYHCVIEREGKHCYLADRGVHPGEGSHASAFGVFLDGDRISPNGRSKLDTRHRSTITLAGADARNPGIFALEAEVWSCSSAMRRICKRTCESRKVSSLILRRRDALPETYIALWECFALGAADPDFDGIIVWREDQGFGYATADAEGWLEPGLTIQTPQCQVSVEEWNQVGM
jgi:pSer/pThr/pTyr-binding forkhead associated (FHA) protein